MRIHILLACVVAFIFWMGHKPRKLNDYIGGLMPNSKPLGVRNNNPLNIRVGNDWQGEAAFASNQEFETFKHHIYGFRAGAILLRNYQRWYGLNTIEQLINRFAPKNENDTDNYVNFVSSQLGIAKNAPVNLEDADFLANLMHKMSIMEVGRHYSLKDAQDGVAIA